MSNCDMDTAVRLRQEIGVINKAPVAFLGKFLKVSYENGVDNMELE